MSPLLSRLAPHGARRTAALAALSALALTGGCLGTDKLTGTNNGGQFTATVTGDLQGTLAGNSEVVPVQATSTTPAGLALGMIDIGGTVVAFQWSRISTLTPGTTQVGTDSTKTLMQLVLPINSTGARYFGTSGTITLSAVTATTATGSFSVTAATGDSSSTINVVGNFQAVILKGGS